jgi:predicted small metal-binding protein
MKQRIIGMILVAVLALSFSALAVPRQDAMQKGAMQKGEMKESPKEMSKDLKEVQCDPACGFMMRSHDEKEVIDATIKHAQKAHGKKISAKDVRGMMKTVAAQTDKNAK